MILKLYRMKKSFLLVLLFGFGLIVFMWNFSFLGIQYNPLQRKEPEHTPEAREGPSESPTTTHNEPTTISDKITTNYSNRYLQFNSQDLVGGDIDCSKLPNCQSSHPSTAEQAIQLCDNEPKCVGFAFLSLTNEVYFKNDITGGLKKKEVVTTYIKAEHAQGLKLPLDDTCAVPVNEAILSNVSQGCNLADFDPFHPSILQHIKIPDLPLKCNGKRLTSYRNGTLSFDNEDTDVTKAEYFSITRSPGSDSDFIQGSLTSLDHKKHNKLKDEFIVVKTKTQDGQEHTEYHGSVVPKPDVITRPRSTTGIPVNVMIVGIDSMSNAHFQRALPKAYKYLSEDLQSIILKGYTIVGDGTTAALTAMLTGYFEHELPEARRGFPQADTVDKWPWIFKDFKKSGYATLFSEDQPNFGSYNYRLYGFKDPPTDHFGRYFWLAASTTTPFCVHGKPQHLIHLDYLETYFEAYTKTPKFGLAFFSAVAHNSLSSLYNMRGDFYTFLKNFEKRLNDTILIVLGDHGFRYGAARATLQGHLEERLPFISFTFPRWFESRYPEIVSNLRHNVKSVTSPFDLHLSLRHILSYPDVPMTPKGSRGSSLFEKIPHSRDCQSAGVLEHYCPCLHLKSADIQHAHVQRSALAIVDHINKMLSEDKYAIDLCHQLSLHQIVSSHQQMPNTKFEQFQGSADIHGRVPKFSEESTKKEECNYRIQIQTRPGDGLFEAPVRFKDGKLTVTGDISRINKYGEQPRCILDKNRELRKYCLCKN